MLRIAPLATLIVLMLPLSVSGQVNGTLEDGRSEEPVEGATVYSASDTSRSNQNGRFSVKIDAPFDTLTFVHPDYRPYQVPVSSPNADLSIQLAPLNHQLNEVVVTPLEANRRLLQATGSISMLKDDELSATSEVSTISAIDRAPGVQYQSATPSTARLTIRGIGVRSPYSTTKVKAYWQGIPLTTGEGVTTLEDIELNTLERAEILKGPVSSIYGAGLGGVVLLQSPTEQSSYVEQEGMAGSFGLWKSSTTANFGQANSSFRLNYTRIHTDGFRKNSRYDRHNAVITGQVEPDDNSQLNVLAAYHNVKGYIPSSLDSATFTDERTAAAENWLDAKGYESYDKFMAGISYQTQFADKLTNRTSIFGHFKHNDEPRPFNILREGRFTYGGRSYLTYSPQIGEVSTKWTLGGEIFREWYHWEIFENNDRERGATINENEQQRNYANASLQASADLPFQLTVQGGVNLNTTNYQLTDLYASDSIDQSGNYSFEPVLSPRLGLNYRATDNISVFASVSRGFSTPSVSETLTPEGRLNEDIQPETGINYELGSRGVLFDDRLSYDLTLFHMRVRNKLVAQRVGPDQYVGVNAGQTKHTGAELSARYAMIQQPGNTLSLLQPFVQYSFGDYRFGRFVDEGVDYSGNRLPATSKHEFAGGLKWGTGFGLGGYVTYQYNGQMPLDDGNNKFTEPWSKLDLRLNYNKAFGPVNLHAYIGINNVWDEHYASMIVPNAIGYGGAAPRYYYPGKPRHFYGGLSIQYRW